MRLLMRLTIAMTLLAGATACGTSQDTQQAATEVAVDVTTSAVSTSTTIQRGRPAPADLILELNVLPVSIPAPQDGRLYSVAGGIEITGISTVETIELPTGTIPASSAAAATDNSTDLDGELGTSSTTEYRAADGHKLYLLEWRNDPRAAAYFEAYRSSPDSYEFYLDIDGVRRALPANSLGEAASRPQRLLVSIPDDANDARLNLASEGLTSAWSLLYEELVEGPSVLYLNEPRVRVNETVRLNHSLPDGLRFAYSDGDATVGGVIEAIGITPYSANLKRKANPGEAFVGLWADISSSEGYLQWDRSVTMTVDGQEFTSGPDLGRSYEWTVPASTTSVTLTFQPVIRDEVGPPFAEEDVQFNESVSVTVDFETGATSIN